MLDSIEIIENEHLSKDNGETSRTEELYEVHRKSKNTHSQNSQEKTLFMDNMLDFFTDFLSLGHRYYLTSTLCFMKI